MKEIASLIETGSYSKEVRRIARAVRLTIQLRRKLTASIISSFLDHVLTPGSEAHAKLSAYLPKVTSLLDLGAVAVENSFRFQFCTWHLLIVI